MIEVLVVLGILMLGSSAFGLFYGWTRIDPEPLFPEEPRAEEEEDVTREAPQA